MSELQPFYKLYTCVCTLVLALSLSSPSPSISHTLSPPPFLRSAKNLGLTAETLAVHFKEQHLAASCDTFLNSGMPGIGSLIYSILGLLFPLHIGLSYADD